jgi:hypothetical protein
MSREERYRGLDGVTRKRLDPNMPKPYYTPLPLSGIGKVPVAPPVEFDPEACFAYEILRYGDRGFSEPGPVEIKILETPGPDRHWLRYVGEFVTEFDPSGEAITTFRKRYKEITEQEAHRELRAAGFEIPLRLGATCITTSKEQRERNAETRPRRLDPVSAEPIEIPQNAVRCTQAQVARFLEQAERGGLIEYLQKEGVLSWQKKIGTKYWVVFTNDNQHTNFQIFVNEEAQNRPANRRNRSRK